MLTLAFDTSTSKGGVALTKDDQVLSRLVWDREGSHGELLTPALQKTLQAAGHTARDLDSIAIGHGPGSFTGVRIAVNAARALAYSLDKPVFTFDTTEILAAGVARGDLPLVAMINAHKNLLFVSTFERSKSGQGWTRTTPIEALSLDQIRALIDRPHLCVGDAYLEFEEVMDPGLRSSLVRDASLSDEPLPDVLGRLAWSERQTRKPMGWKDVQALYIRASGAEEKLREGHGK